MRELASNEIEQISGGLALEILIATALIGGAAVVGIGGFAVGAAVVGVGALAVGTLAVTYMVAQRESGTAEVTPFALEMGQPAA
jgi:hypothetical protein